MGCSLVSNKPIISLLVELISQSGHTMIITNLLMTLWVKYLWTSHSIMVLRWDNTTALSWATFCWTISARCTIHHLRKNLNRIFRIQIKIDHVIIPTLIQAEILVESSSGICFLAYPERPKCRTEVIISIHSAKKAFCFLGSSHS